MNKSTIALLAVVLLLGLDRAGRADESQARDVLKNWLKDAGAANPGTPPSSTGVPFQYRTTNAKKRCEGSFSDAKALVGWWKCFRKAESYLLTDFQNGGEIKAPSPAGPPPKELAALAKPIKVPGTWSQGVFTGDGMTSHFFFLTTESGQLAALLIDVDFF